MASQHSLNLLILLWIGSEELQFSLDINNYPAVFTKDHQRREL